MLFGPHADGNHGNRNFPLSQLNPQLFHVAHGHCHDLPWLIEFSGVVLSCFTFSRRTLLTEVLSIQPDDSRIALLRAIVYSNLWVRKLVHTGEIIIVTLAMLFV